MFLTSFTQMRRDTCRENLLPDLSPLTGRLAGFKVRNLPLPKSSWIWSDGITSDEEIKLNMLNVLIQFDAGACCCGPSELAASIRWIIFSPMFWSSDSRSDWRGEGKQPAERLLNVTLSHCWVSLSHLFFCQTQWASLWVKKSVKIHKYERTSV